MSDPFAQSFSFGTATADELDLPVEPVPPPADPRPEPTSEPPPSQVRFGEPAPPANDVAGKANPDIDRTVLFKRLSDRRLRTEFLTYLIKKKELVPHRADDVVQKTYLRAIRAKTWPDEEQKMLGWMKSIADRSFVDDLRKRERQAAVEEPHEDVDVAEEPRDDGEAQHVAEVARMVAAETARDAETLQMITAQAAGEPLPSILARWSISRKTFFKRKSRFASTLKKRLVEIASLSTASLALMLIFHALTMVTLSMVGSAPTAPGPHDPLPALPSHEDAGTLRSKALGHCERHEYARCLEFLNRAKTVDPEGDTDPKIVSARHEAEKGAQ